MSAGRRFLKRYWSLLVAFLIVALQVHGREIDLGLVDFLYPPKVVWTMCAAEVALTLLCLGLLFHSWHVQRGFARNKGRLVFWAHVLLLPAICSIVLGLSVIQLTTYDSATESDIFQSLHRYAGDAKDLLIWLVPLDLVLIVLWAIVAVFKSKSGRPDAGPA
jgi:hypothetical protein